MRQIIPRKKDGTFQMGFISPLRNGEFRKCKLCNSKFYIQGFRITDKKRGKWCSKECYYKTKIGKRVSIETEFKKGERVGKEHLFWKGDDVGYYALHTWIYRNWGRPKMCQMCNKSNRKYEWANITGTYKRVKKHWKQLCVSCHRKEDKIKPKKPNL